MPLGHISQYVEILLLNFDTPLGLNQIIQQFFLWIFIIDYRSYIHNLSSCEIISLKKFRAEQDSNPSPATPV